MYLQDGRSAPLAGLGASELRLAVVRLRSLGDVVLMTPVATAARRVPGCRVAVVVEEPFDEVLMQNPHIDRLLVVSRSTGKARARLRAVGELRSFRPHVALDLHGGPTSAFIARLSGAECRVGYAQSRNSYLYNVKVPGSREIWGKTDVHTVEHQLSPLRHLGFPVEPLPPLTVVVDSVELEEVRAQLARLGVEQDFILIHPAAAFETKQWEAEKFAVLAHRLVGDGHTVVFTAGPGQAPVLERIRTQAPAEVRWIPPSSVRRFAALASLCRVYVGNDTGATHVAAALGRKIVVIFGSSDYRVWFPWGVEHRLVRSDYPCVPCPGYRCLAYQEPECIRSISVDRALAAVRELL